MTADSERPPVPESKRAAPDPAGRRSDLAEALAGIVLRDGLGDLGLRGVAAKLGTSDRMLIYYFETKERLVLDMLDRVSARLSVILAANSNDPPMSPGQFLARVLALSHDPEVAPFIRLWTEVIARGARGEAPYNQVAPRVVGSWIAWIDSRLIRSDDAHAAARPAALLSIVEGVSLLELAAPGSTRDAQPYLVSMLDAAFSQ